MGDRIKDVKFSALRNAIYHTARRHFLDRCNRILSFVVIIAGAGVVGQIGARAGVADMWLALVAMAAGALQLVFDLGVRARDHEFLQRRYYELLADVARHPSPEEGAVCEWEGELNRLYGEEPPPLRALEAIAHNAACDSLGREDWRVPVSLWQSLMRHVLPFNGSLFRDKKPSVEARA